jgi:hypothetical protein
MRHARTLAYAEATCFLQDQVVGCACLKGNGRHAACQRKLLIR